MGVHPDVLLLRPTFLITGMTNNFKINFVIFVKSAQKRNISHDESL